MVEMELRAWRTCRGAPSALFPPQLLRNPSPTFLRSQPTTLTTDVTLTPSRDWDTGSGKARASLLGLSVRVCNPAAALESVWHILEVLEGSPAEVGYDTWGRMGGDEGAEPENVEDEQENGEENGEEDEGQNEETSGRALTADGRPRAVRRLDLRMGGRTAAWRERVP